MLLMLSPPVEQPAGLRALLRLSSRWRRPRFACANWWFGFELSPPVSLPPGQTPLQEWEPLRERETTRELEPTPQTFRTPNLPAPAPAPAPVRCRISVPTAQQNPCPVYHLFWLQPLLLNIVH